MDKLMFVAEIGSNFFGSVDIAKYLMDRAKWAGANLIKMQLWKCDDLYKPDWEFYEHAKKSELTYDKARELKKYADEIGIGWFASVHTKEDIDFLVDIKADFIKIKGSQSDDDELVEYAINPDILMIISHTHSKYRQWSGRTRHLYTTLKYPSKWEDVDFKNLQFFNGFSDHTKGIQASLCAAMLPNIRIFERHFTGWLLEEFKINESGTPDYCVSLYPNEFKELVQKIRHIKQQEK